MGVLIRPKSQTIRVYTEKEFAKRYPAIGAAARWQLLGRGPGGAAETLQLTSSNKKIDIYLTHSNTLPAGVSAPIISIEQFAKSILALFEI